MKQYFLAPITSLDGAHAFFDALAHDGLLFHPEDNPADVVNSRGLSLFEAAECEALKARINEVYMYDLNPCVYCLEIMNKE